MYRQVVMNEKLHIHDLVELDEIVYTDAFQVEHAVYHSWFLKNPDLFLALAHESDPQRVIAYIGALPLKLEYAERVREGVSTDSSLPADAVIAAGTRGIHTLYFSSIVIHPAHRGGIVVGCLIDLFLTKLIELSHRGIYFSEMIADIVSSSGNGVGESFGMNLIRDSDHDSRIMSVSMLPPLFNPASRASIRLKRRYTELFRQIEATPAGPERRVTSPPLGQLSSIIMESTCC